MTDKKQPPMLHTQNNNNNNNKTQWITTLNTERNTKEECGYAVLATTVRMYVYIVTLLYSGQHHYKERKLVGNGNGNGFPEQRLR